MTTIAVRDGIVAVDSLMVGGWSRRGYTDKAVSFNGHIYAGCGAYDAVVRFFEWAEKGEPKDFNIGFKGDDFAGLIVRFPDGRPHIWTCETALIPWQVRTPFTARGSGCDYAVGAMGMGATAPIAVQVAAQFDLGTGGPIRVWKRLDNGEISVETHT